MRRFALFLLAAGITACAPMSRMFDRGPRPDPNVESQYHRAIGYLEPGSTTAALDSAIRFLDGYLAHAGYIERRSEAQILKRLASDAIQLSRVAAALQQERAANSERTKAGDTAAAPKSDTDSLKEIQRLKDELAAANAELERIRKRLATQKP